MFSLFLFLHLLGAIAWSFSFLVLLFTVCFRLWSQRPLQALTIFRRAYRQWGLVALIVQVITGLCLVTLSVVDLGLLFTDALDPLLQYFWLKLLLVLLIFCLAFNARYRVIPLLALDVHRRLPSVMLHLLVGLLASVALVGVGLGLYFRWLPLH